MANFVKFTDNNRSVNGTAVQEVFVNPDHVRALRPDYDYGGTLIQLDVQRVSVREEMVQVVRALMLRGAEEEMRAADVIGNPTLSGINLVTALTRN